ncbi:hypothetical protein PM082_009964 [Marasmius tenuissimus]|nr:hypothetical protein PM082_009964 [Marasmius tenuissimus]
MTVDAFPDLPVRRPQKPKRPIATCPFLPPSRYDQEPLTKTDGWGIVYAALAYQAGLPDPLVVKVGRTKRALKTRMLELRRQCPGHRQYTVAAWYVPRHIRTGSRFHRELFNFKRRASTLESVTPIILKSARLALRCPTARSDRCNRNVEAHQKPNAKNGAHHLLGKHLDIEHHTVDSHSMYFLPPTPVDHL